MKICYTALFGNYEELKDPAVISKGWEYICFTDQSLTSNVWQIRRVDISQYVGDDHRHIARYFKIMEWVDWAQSIWVDASFKINIDLNDWWERYFDKGFSVPKHPQRNCVYEEIDACIAGHRGVMKDLFTQKQTYLNEGVKPKQGIITSGIIMRENRPEVIELCERWWMELTRFSLRDQVAFYKVCEPYGDFIHRYDYNYTTKQDFIYKKHFDRR